MPFTSPGDLPDPQIKPLSPALAGRATREAPVMYYPLKKQKNEEGFPGGLVVSNPPGNAGDTGPVPELERSHMPWSN